MVAAAGVVVGGVGAGAVGCNDVRAAVFFVIGACLDSGCAMQRSSNRTNTSTSSAPPRAGPRSRFNIDSSMFEYLLHKKNIHYYSETSGKHQQPQ
jgi:hypothetical protein